MLLSLVLAHSDCVARLRGQRPVLLLDEVAAHLDPLRRGRALRTAGGAGRAGVAHGDRSGAVRRHAGTRDALSYRRRADRRGLIGRAGRALPPPRPVQ